MSPWAEGAEAESAAGESRHGDSSSREVLQPPHSGGLRFAKVGII